LNSNYCVNIPVVRESEYLPALQTLMIVIDSNRKKNTAASFILQRTWQQVIISKLQRTQRLKYINECLSSFPVVSSVTYKVMDGF